MLRLATNELDIDTTCGWVMVHSEVSVVTCMYMRGNDHIMCSPLNC